MDDQPIEPVEETEDRLVLRPGDVVRTKQYGTYILRDSAWGRYLLPCEDPDGLPLDDLVGRIQLAPDFPRIPPDLWGRVIDLYFAAEKGLFGGQTEVAVCLFRHREDLTKWRIVVPTQEVSGASCEVDYTKPCVDIVTGEQFPESSFPDWRRAGTSHSHHVMTAQFSSTDDENELPQPGLHIVVGKMQRTPKPTYVPTASIVQKKTRYSVRAEDVIDLTVWQGEGFHPNVKEVVDRKTYATVGFGSALGHSYYDDYYKWSDYPTKTKEYKDVSTSLGSSLFLTDEERLELLMKRLEDNLIELETFDDNPRVTAEVDKLFGIFGYIPLSEAAEWSFADVEPARLGDD